MTTKLVSIATNAMEQWMIENNKSVVDLPDQLKRFNELDDSARCISKGDLLILTGIEPKELQKLIDDGEVIRADHRYAKWSVGEAREIIEKHEAT